MMSKKPEFNGAILSNRKEEEYREKGQWSTRLQLGEVGSPGIIFKEEEKRKQSQELNNDIEEFLARGGKIEQLD